MCYINRTNLVYKKLCPCVEWLICYIDVQCVFVVLSKGFVILPLICSHKLTDLDHMILAWLKPWMHVLKLKVNHTVFPKFYTIFNLKKDQLLQLTDRKKNIKIKKLATNTHSLLVNTYANMTKNTVRWVKPSFGYLRNVSIVVRNVPKKCRSIFRSEKQEIKHKILFY